MTEHHFETHEPVELYVENGKGTVQVHATDTTESRVELSGPDAEDVQVDYADGHLSVIAPKHRGGLFSGNQQLDMTITVPSTSSLAAKLGSADLLTTGTLASTQVRSGSGDVSLDHLAGDALVETGSGDVRVQHAEAQLRVKSGSGDVNLDRAGADLRVSTGSGDVRVGTAAGAVVVKTGSGDLKVADAHTDVSLTTGSGDMAVDSVRSGRLTIKAASGDLRVGVPAGIPVWTDVSTVSGRIHSTLEGSGQPEPGADYVEVRATTVSGDVDLVQI